MGVSDLQVRVIFEDHQKVERSTGLCLGRQSKKAWSYGPVETAIGGFSDINVDGNFQKE